jgi:hypothetical protein
MYLGALGWVRGVAISGFSFRASAKRLIHQWAPVNYRLVQHSQKYIVGAERRSPKPGTPDLGPNPSGALECSVTSAVNHGNAGTQLLADHRGDAAA